MSDNLDAIEKAVGNQNLAFRIYNERGLNKSKGDDSFEYWHTRASNAPKGSEEQMGYILKMDEKVQTFDQRDIICSFTEENQEIYKKQIIEMSKMDLTHEQLCKLARKFSSDSPDYKYLVSKMFLKATTHSECFNNFSFSHNVADKKRALSDMFAKAITHYDWYLNCLYSDKGSQESIIAFGKMFEMSVTVHDDLLNYRCATADLNAKKQAIESAFRRAETFDDFKKIKEIVQEESEWYKKATDKMVETGSLRDWEKELKEARSDSTWQVFCINQVNKGTFEEIIRILGRLNRFEMEEKFYPLLVAKDLTLEQMGKLYYYVDKGSYAELRDLLFEKIKNHPDIQTIVNI
jgi:hypothetical protein